VLRAVTKSPNLHDRTHAFSDVHEFREWMGAVREDEEQDAATDDLLSGRVTIANTPVEHLGRHAGARRTCDLGHAYGAFSGGEMRYGYCGSCDLILECERVPPPDPPTFAHHNQEVWFPIEWDRRSRDGWIRARNERALDRARSRTDCYHDEGDFESEDDDEGDDDI
jgi:hypothetical protein